MSSSVTEATTTLPQRTATRGGGAGAPQQGTSRAVTALQVGLGWFPEHPGGLDRYYYELLPALGEQGVSCRGLVVGSDEAARATGGLVRAFASADASLPQRLLAVRAATRDAVARGEIDLIVSHFALYAAGALGAVAERIPMVVHFHGPWAGEGRAEGDSRLAGWGKAFVERAVYRRASRLICLSESFAQILRRDYRIRNDSIRIVPGAVDVQRFAGLGSRAESRARLGWPTDRPIVFCVRRLVRRMGLANLIDAAADVRRSHPDVLFLIAGRGAIFDELRQHIARAGLDQTVRLLGYLPDADLPAAYRAADLTVMPSVTLEGFGLSAAESLAAGTPALVTPVGGLPDVVRPLAPELVLPDAGIGSLVEGLSAALAGRLRLPGPDACREYARNRFDWRVVAAAIAEIYGSVL